MIWFGPSGSCLQVNALRREVQSQFYQLENPGLSDADDFAGIIHVNRRGARNFG
jgi:hypothetical protein